MESEDIMGYAQANHAAQELLLRPDGIAKDDSWSNYNYDEGRAGATGTNASNQSSFAMYGGGTKRRTNYNDEENESCDSEFGNFNPNLHANTFPNILPNQSSQ